MGLFLHDLPCALEEEEASEPSTSLRKSITSVCGQEYTSGPLCCTQDQVDALKTNLEQVEPLLSACPACRNNFRSLFCSMTCSPNQSTFLDVVQSQKTPNPGQDGDVAVKEMDYWISEDWRSRFYKSCENVKFGAGNAFVMDFFGGATDADSLLKFLGDKRDYIGSPFQINFPHLKESSNGTQTPPSPLDTLARNCDDEELLSRCACTDCPAVCATLPALSPPNHQDTCFVTLPGGRHLSCFAMGILLLYLIALTTFFTGVGIGRRSRKKRAALHHRYSGISVRSEGSGFERVRLSSEEAADGNRSSGEASPQGRLLGASANDVEEESVSSSGAAGGRGVLAGLGLGSRGATGGDDLSALSSSQPRSYAPAVWLSRFFYRLGFICASYPYLTFAVALLFVGLANLGWKNFEVETDPVRLWVSPGSEAKHRKEYFDEQFGPFYRTQQVFIMDESAAQISKSGISHQGQAWSDLLGSLPAALSWERLQWWAEVEDEIRKLTSTNGTTFQDVCFAPSGPGGPCVVQSIMGYFGDDLSSAGVTEESWKDSLDACAATPAECLPAFGQPLKRNIVLGGVPEKAKASEARSLVTTWVVSNSLQSEVVLRAQEWESTLEAFLFSIAGIGNGPEHPLGARRRELGLSLSLSTEISLEQELAKSGRADVLIVVLSYLLMFLYASLTLGGSTTSTEKKGSRSNIQQSPLRSGLAGRIISFLPSHRPFNRRISSASPWTTFIRRACIQSKFSLGLFGILVVLASVSSAVGLFSALGVKVTLVIAEVLPFLLLAVGVDNIFLLAGEMDRQNSLASAGHLDHSSRPSQDVQDDDDEDGSIEDNMAYGAGMSRESNGPSNVTSAERAARTLSRVGPSILLSATVQVCAFLLGATIPMPAVRHFALYAAASMAFVATLQCTVFVAAMALDADRVQARRVDCLPCIKFAPSPSASNGPLSSSSTSTDGLLSRFFRHYYAPMLMKRRVKQFILVLFGTIFAISCISVRHLHMGLDQRLALPAGSYLRDYFNSIDAFLDVGPPVYFVARDIDVTTRAGQQALCGRFTTCHPLSLANTLEGERVRSNVSFLAEPASSWLDDFFQWLNPVLETCCRVKISNPNVFCTPSDGESDCQPCFLARTPAWNITLDGMPEGDEFMKYLRQWLKSPTDADCPLGGQAAYSSALSIDEENNKVISSNFRSFHTPLRSQADFIDALSSSTRISSEISARNGPTLDVFAYSVFTPFFDQYLYLGSLALQLLGGSLLAILVVTTILLGSIRTAIIVGVCISNAVFCVAAIMATLGIGVNALTLVNLAVCSAICVEFCAHVARAFMRAPGSLSRKHPMAQKERDDRIWAALVDVGPAVVSGITGTKLVGISVLFWAQSEM
jgi:Niemann-Pick C1 protein